MPVDFRRTLSNYFALTYVALLATLATFLFAAARGDAIALAFSVSVYLTYAVFYLLPLASLTFALSEALSRAPRLQRVVAGTVGVLGAALLDVYLYGDGRLYDLYGFHVNGMVWNLVTTRGGVESLDGGESSFHSAAAIALGFVALQGALMLAARSRIAGAALGRLHTRRFAVAASLALLGLAGFERATYAIAYGTQHGSVLEAADKFPLYLPTRARSLTSALGFGAPAGDTLLVEPVSGEIHYPLHAIERRAHPAYNIVWLVAESLRADALDPEIMPATWSFAQKAHWFRTHYSGGNCTRMGVFSMFYGLHGSYWFPFQTYGRGPVLLDLLLADQYQIELRTSARFSYPEFDETVFARVPRERMYEAAGSPGWRSDEAHVGGMLDFIARRDPARPFMTFLFFESPHARYQFPPESVIRTPYLEELDYATMDVARDMPLIVNRYLNSVHHLDSQLARVFAYLEANDLLDSTIVVVTGDHGEEFMEKGRWGHGSGFSEEQTNVPLVLWVPGEKPARIDRMTSHVDLAPTLMRLLGVSNPPSDYSNGFDLLDGPARSSTVVSGWSDLAIISADHKIVLPFGQFDFSLRSRVTTRNDGVESKRDAVLSGARSRILELLHEMGRFAAVRG